MNYLTKIPKLIKNNLMYLSGITTATAITFGLSVTAHADTNSIIYSFSSESVRHWQFVSDGVMGGISTGKLQFEEDDGIKFCRLTGTVSTANNGGFIQFRASVSFKDEDNSSKDVKGVRLAVRGNESEYFVHFRTSDNWAPSDYYYARFNAGAEWTNIDLPFQDFKRRRSDQSIMLKGNNIQSMGIVAYGRDHKADVSVSRIEFYY
jgi:hypothetical protein